MAIAAYILICMLATYVPTTGYKCSMSRVSQYISEHSTKKSICTFIDFKASGITGHVEGCFMTNTYYVCTNVPVRMLLFTFPLCVATCIV